MKTSSKQPVVIITGASQGIGAAIAKLFSTSGFSTALLARNTKAIQAMNLPNSLAIKTDITDFSAFKIAIAKAEEVLGPVDCLINNAGFCVGGDFTEISHNDHERMVQLNVLGVMNGIEAVLPSMRVRKTGTIINISSVADRHVRPQISTYAATKAAVKLRNDGLGVCRC